MTREELAELKEVRASYDAILDSGVFSDRERARARLVVDLITDKLAALDAKPAEESKEWILVEVADYAEKLKTDAERASRNFEMRCREHEAYMSDIEHNKKAHEISQSLIQANTAQLKRIADAIVRYVDEP